MQCLKCGEDFSAMEQVPHFTDKGGNQVQVPTLLSQCGMNYAPRDQVYAAISKLTHADAEHFSDVKKLGRIDGIYGQYVYVDTSRPTATDVVEKLLE